MYKRVESFVLDITKFCSLYNPEDLTQLLPSAHGMPQEELRSHVDILMTEFYKLREVCGKDRDPISFGTTVVVVMVWWWWWWWW